MRIGVNGQSVSHWESLSQLAWVRVNCGIETLVDTNDYPTIWGISQKEFSRWWLTKRILQKSIRVWFLSSAVKRKRALYSHSRWPHWRIVVTMTTPESTGVEPNKRSRVSELSIFSSLPWMSIKTMECAFCAKIQQPAESFNQNQNLFFSLISSK
jgi:hypothetical protein